MRKRMASTLLVVALVLVACEQAASLLPGALRCGATDAELCGRVSLLAVA
jgi:hypothetical protein